MVHIIIKLSFLLAAMKWGDWKNWQKYYPTILFFIIGDLLYHFMFFNYPMWTFGDSHGWEYPESFVVLAMLVITYPATILIFLGRFPRGFWKGVGWILLWMSIYTIIEVGDVFFNTITYYNGWNLMWSAVLNLTAFTLLKLHHHRPLYAWGCAVVFILVLWNIFDVPIEILK